MNISKMIVFVVVNIAVFFGLFYPKINEYNYLVQKQEDDEWRHAELQRMARKLDKYKKTLPCYLETKKIHSYFFKKKLNNAKIKILINKMGKKVGKEIFPEKLSIVKSVNTAEKPLIFYEPLRYRIEADFTYKKLMKFLALLATNKEFLIIKELEIASFRKENYSLERVQVKDIFLKADIIVEFFASKKQES